MIGIIPKTNFDKLCNQNLSKEEEFIDLQEARLNQIVSKLDAISNDLLVGFNIEASNLIIKMSYEISTRKKDLYDKFTSHFTEIIKHSDNLKIWS